MKITLLSSKEYTSITLPSKCAGQYWLYLSGENGHRKEIIAVEGIHSDEEDIWQLKSNAAYQINRRNPETGNLLAELELQERDVIPIVSSDNQETCWLLVEPVTEDRVCYRAYQIMANQMNITIGRLEDNVIVSRSQYVGRNQAVIRISNGFAEIQNLSKTNPTYVNNRSFSTTKLSIGDAIYFCGIQMIYMGKLLFINNPDETISVKEHLLREYHPIRIQIGKEMPRNEGNTDTFYHRPLRFKYEPDELKLKLDPPPEPPKEDETPVLLSVGPSVTMGMASTTMASYSIINAIQSGNMTAAIPSVAMCVSMLAGTMLWPTLLRRYQKKKNIEDEKKRQLYYGQYLNEQQGQIQRAIAEQERLLVRNDGTIDYYLKRIMGKEPQMWERTPKNSDFLHVRLGVGILPMKLDIQYPERSFSMTKDNLTEAMYSLGEQQQWLKNVPICLSLKENYISGFAARQGLRWNFAKSLLLQLSLLYSYDEVKLAVIYDKADEAQLSFVRWLPHIMDDEKRVRYLATDAKEVQTLSSDLNGVIEYRKKLSKEAIQDALPFYVVLCLDKTLARQTECLQNLMRHRDYLGISVLYLFEELKDLPQECSAVMALHRDMRGEMVLIQDVCSQPVNFMIDIPNAMNVDTAIRVIANQVLDIGRDGFKLPQKYSFMEMLDVGMVEHINLLERWDSNDPTKSLAAPIGIDPYGDPFVLDIHERCHGPHGLVAGMTGSGKSESIMTYILSMVLNHHPHEVAFILIDYKGGGMAKAFEELPHTAGIITNLDGSTMNRSLVSLNSEIHRREQIFSAVSQKYGISNIDIYKYQKLFREKRVTEPLPHLVIISDEFAELKDDQPDFMDALTSAARVGRSLGVHLILATQKPGGVVNEQIRSNSRFRLCLKVQDRGDSNEMLNRPEAADLMDTGRFYLQVGNNEVFALGQSAWAGAPYHPSTKVIKERNDAISVINTNGRVMMEVNISPHTAKQDAPKQLDTIVQYICKVSEKEQIPTWKMWLPPLPAILLLDELRKKYKEKKKGGLCLCPIVGEYDNPEQQSQGLLRVPLTECGNAIVYGAAGSGKGMFLNAMCISLMQEHTPQEVCFYLLDFDSEALKCFSAAPHVGDVVLANESDKVTNLFKLLYAELEKRKSLFAAYGGSLEQYNQHENASEGSVVVIIHNFAGFSELYDTKMELLNILSREGTKYGIYFILTCSGVNHVRMSLRQNFKNIYCLNMNDEGDYSTIVGKLGKLSPEWHEGRGMFRADKTSLYEFQTASVTAQASVYQELEAWCQKMKDGWKGKAARRIPVLPEYMSRHFLESYAQEQKLSTVPIGMEKESLQIAFWNLASMPVHLVLAEDGQWKAFTKELAVLLAHSCGVQTMILDASAEESYGYAEGLSVYQGRKGCIDGVSKVFQTVLARNNAYKTALEEGTELPQFEPLCVVLRSMAELGKLLTGIIPPDSMSEDDSYLLRLNLALEKTQTAYQVTFIVANDIHDLAPLTAEAWYKEHIRGNSGVWLGSGISNQYRLSVSKKPDGFHGTVDDGFGYLVKNGAAALIKYLQ